MNRVKGLQAFRVISMDESTAIQPIMAPPSKSFVTVTATSGLERAVVKWFNRVRGYGFLTRGEGTDDIFVHMETLRRSGLEVWCRLPSDAERRQLVLRNVL